MNAENISYETVPIKAMDLLKESKALMGENYWLFVGICAVGLIIGGAVPANILLGPMMCGIYLCFFHKMTGGQVKFETLFKGFDYFKDSLIASLLLLVIWIAVIIPLYVLYIVMMLLASSLGGDGGLAGIMVLLASLMFFFILLVAFCIIAACTLFVYPLITDRKLEAIPALKLSYRAGRANFKGLIVYCLILGLIGAVAAILCYIPVFFFAPIALGATAILYTRVFPGSLSEFGAVQASPPPAPNMQPPAAPPPPPA